MPKIVQTLWTAPWMGLSPKSVRCGWITPLHHLCGFVYSAYCARKTYGNIHLVTDSFGAKFLVDTLKIDFDSVTVALDKLPVPPHIWKYPRFVSYGIQDEPFFHIDSDSFFLQKLPAEYESAQVVIQHQDGIATIFDNYPEGAFIVDGLKHEDDGWAEFSKDRAAFNVSIFGGADIEVINRYSHMAQRLVANNMDKLGACTEKQLQFITHTLDRKLSYCYMNRHKVNVKPVIDPIDWLNIDQNANKKGYVHLMGRKHEPTYVSRLLARMQSECPKHFDVVRSYLSQSTKPKEPSKVFAVVSVFDEPGILPHFLDHYAKLGVDQILVANHVEIPEQAEYEKKFPVRFFSDDDKVFNNDAKSRCELKALEMVGAKPWDWVMHLDLDEFHQYPIDLKSLCLLMEKADIDAILGTFLDRCNAEGTLPKITGAPIDDQFPLQGLLTEKLVCGRTEKIMLAKFMIPIGGGRHETTDGTVTRRYPIGDPLDYRVHHFRWSDGLVERLESRFTNVVKFQPERSYPQQTIKFCENYRKKGKFDLTAPELCIQPAPKLAYPELHPVVDVLLNSNYTSYATDDNDSKTLSEFIRQYNPKRVLEIGPGRSTLVWAFRGCEVDGLEFMESEVFKMRQQFRNLPNVRIHHHGFPISANLPYEKYDVAFVDGPSGKLYKTHSRLDAVLYALERSDMVLLHDSNRLGEQQTIQKVRSMGYEITDLKAPRGIVLIQRKHENHPQLMECSLAGNAS